MNIEITKQGPFIRMIRIVDMIFAYKAGGVSGICKNPSDIHSVRFQSNIESRECLGTFRAFIEKGVGMRGTGVASGKEGISRRCADRTGHMGIMADHSFLGQPVEVGGQNFSSVRAGLRLVVIVDQEDDDIGSVRLFPEGWVKQNAEKKREVTQAHGDF